MPYCNHCGRYIERGTFCDWCQENTQEEPKAPEAEVEPQEETHEETTQEAPLETPEEAPKEETPQRKKRYFAAPLRHTRLSQGVRSLLDTPDTTAVYTLRDARDGRVMSMLCYLWILWVIPFFLKRSSPFVRYHLGQGLMLLLMDCLGVTFIGISLLLDTLLPVAAPAFMALGEVALLLSCLLKLFGIICALGGKAKELPLVGSYGRHP